MLLRALEHQPLGQPSRRGTTGRLVDVDSTSLDAVRIGALPVVNHFLARLDVGKLLEDYVPADPRATLPYSAVLLVLVQSLVVERAPV